MSGFPPLASDLRRARVRRGASLAVGPRALLALLLTAAMWCLPASGLSGAWADDDDKGRKGFDFGKPDAAEPEKGASADKDGGKAGASGRKEPLSDVDAEIVQLKGWPARPARRAAEALFLRQQDAVPALVRALEGQDADVQAGAAWVLGKVGEPAHVNVILKSAARRVNAHRVREFFDAAYELSPKATKRWLVGFLTIANRPVFRSAAAEFLAATANEEDRPSVLALLDSDQAAVREAALGLLIAAGVPDAVDRIFVALSDLSPEVAYGAARELARVEDPDVLARLNAVAREDGARERAYATLALVEIARSTGGNPFEDATIQELAGRRGILHPEKLSRGTAAAGLAFGGLEIEDPALASLLDSTVVDVLIDTVGGAHFRDFSSVSPSVFAALRRLSGRDLPNTAVDWARWWQQARTGFRARRPLKKVDASDMLRAYVGYVSIDAQGRRRTAEFVPQGGAVRPGALVLRAPVFESLIAFLEDQGIFDAQDRGQMRGDEHLTVTLGVMNQRRRLQLAPMLAGVSQAEQEANARTYATLRMRFDSLVDANIWQNYRDADVPGDALSWWDATDRAMAQAGPDERAALLQAAIVAAYDDLSDDLHRAEALLRLREMNRALSEADAGVLADVLSASPAFGVMEADGVRWLLGQGHERARQTVIERLAERVEPDARQLLAGVLFDRGTEFVREAFADPRAGMRAGAAQAARMLVEQAAGSATQATERAHLVERLRPGLEVLSADEDPAVSIRALLALAYMGDQGVVDRLESLYRSGRFNVRLEVVRAMGYVPGKRAHPFLTFVMSEEKGNEGAALRASALESMARSGHKDAVRLLVFYLLTDKDQVVNEAAGRALAELGTAEARFALVERLAQGEPDAVLRARLADVLGRFQGDVVEERLLALLGDAERRVQWVAAVRAANLGLAQAFPYLLDLLRRGEGALRDEAVEAAENLSSVVLERRGYNELADAYESWYSEAKSGNWRLWLREALKSRSYDVGPLTAWLAGEESLEAVPVLARALRDGAPVLRRNAARALEQASGRSMGKVDRSTPVAEAGRLADRWLAWVAERQGAR